MDIEDGEKDRDTLHPALEELILFDLINQRHRSVGRGDREQGISWRDPLRISEEP